MPYQPAANLSEAAEFAPRNTIFAHDDPAENLKTISEAFRDQFFSLLSSADVSQLEILRWSIIVQYGIALTTPGGTSSRVEDAWRLGFSVTAACREAAVAEVNSKITPALAASLLAAYNSAFS